MTKFDHGISRLQMTRLQLVIYLVIFNCVTPTMEKIENLKMNLYILLNSNTADGFRDPFKGCLNLSAVLEFSKMYKFIVKFVIFSIARVTQLKMTKKLPIVIWSFVV